MGSVLLCALALLVVGFAGLAPVRVAPAQFACDPIAFIDRFLPLNEKGQPWSLSAYQRRVLALALVFDTSGRLGLRLLLWSEPKKSGKTYIAACLATWWSATRAYHEVVVVANDKEQAQGRVFRTMVALCRTNGLEASKLVTIRATTLEFASGTRVDAIAGGYADAAGGRHSLVIFDEIWGFQSENLRRLFEELTPPPSEPNAWTLIVSYAGFVGESQLLESLYQRAMAAPRIDADLEVYRDGEFVCFWSHTPRQPWQTPEYYAQQRRSLRPATFARIHRNEWVSSESKFITAETWDACVEPALRPVLADGDLEISVAADFALKHDNAAIVAVAWDGTRLRLVAHRLWKPTPGETLDLEQTVEQFIRDLHERFSVLQVVVDPWQAARSIATLKADGIPIREMPQTSGTLTAMATTLFDVLEGRNIRLYPASDLREHALNATAFETPRGLKIAKTTASKKIDGAVALAMACVAAIEHGPGADMPLLYSSDPGSAYQQWAQQQRRGGTAPDDEPEPEDDVIECEPEAMALRPDADDWEPVPLALPHQERRRRHAADLLSIVEREGYWTPGAD